MNKRCINPNSIQVKELSDELGLKPIIVAAKIAVWQDKNNTYDFPSANDLVEGINYSIKAVDILLSDKAKQVFDKGNKNNWSLDKILTELAIPKEQKELIENSYNNLLFIGKNEKGNDLIIKPTAEELAIDLMQYEFKVNLDVSKGNSAYDPSNYNDFVYNNIRYYIKEDDNWGEDEYFKGNKKIDSDEYNEANKNYNQNLPSKHYSNLTVPGGTNYTENEISTPNIVPNIKGHSAFSTDSGIGWIRSDDMVEYSTSDIDTLINLLEKSGQLTIDCE